MANKSRFYQSSQSEIDNELLDFSVLTNESTPIYASSLDLENWDASLGLQQENNNANQFHNGVNGSNFRKEADNLQNLDQPKQSSSNGSFPQDKINRPPVSHCSQQIPDLGFQSANLQRFSNQIPDGVNYSTQNVEVIGFIQTNSENEISQFNLYNQGNHDNFQINSIGDIPVTIGDIPVIGFMEIPVHTSSDNQQSYSRSVAGTNNLNHQNSNQASQNSSIPKCLTNIQHQSQRNTISQPQQITMPQPQQHTLPQAQNKTILQTRLQSQQHTLPQAQNKTILQTRLQSQQLTVPQLRNSTISHPQQDIRLQSQRAVGQEQQRSTMSQPQQSPIGQQQPILQRQCSTGSQLAIPKPQGETNNIPRCSTEPPSRQTSQNEPTQAMKEAAVSERVLQILTKMEEKDNSNLEKSHGSANFLSIAAERYFNGMQSIDDINFSKSLLPTYRIFLHAHECAVTQCRYLKNLNFESTDWIVFCIVAKKILNHSEKCNQKAECTLIDCKRLQKFQAHFKTCNIGTQCNICLYLVLEFDLNRQIKTCNRKDCSFCWTMIQRNENCNESSDPQITVPPPQQTQISTSSRTSQLSDHNSSSSHAQSISTSNNSSTNQTSRHQLCELRETTNQAQRNNQSQQIESIASSTNSRHIIPNESAQNQMKKELELLFHTFRCLKQREQYCSKPGCLERKRILTHLFGCHVGKSCSVPECTITRRTIALYHVKTCLNRKSCFICQNCTAKDGKLSPILFKLMLNEAVNRNSGISTANRTVTPTRFRGLNIENTGSQTSIATSLSHDPPNQMSHTFSSSESRLSAESVNQTNEVAGPSAKRMKPEELIEDVEKQDKPESEKNDDELCRICMDAPLDSVFLECGHIVACMTCGEKSKNCPICREKITRVKKIFKA
ncbi:hypothetical protein HHI36_021748 [Cryptolaemus montrouzieri]|uniref:Uncharacterized protein n=1 Tax=Cryptolaemus montrouzieri TaxID=559131 RepID=A0ABD2MYQ3_9CUCU